jgi:hypothetical protein
MAAAMGSLTSRMLAVEILYYTKMWLFVLCLFAVVPIPNLNHSLFCAVTFSV